MKMGLKNKFLAAVLGVVFFIVVCSTAVVAVLLQRQNKAAAQESLKATLNIILDDLQNRHEKQQRDTLLFIRSNKIGEKVKFISDFNRQGQIEFTRSSVLECVQGLSQLLVTGGLWQVAIYDGEGRIMAFAQALNSGQELMAGYAYHAKGSQFVYSRVPRGASMRDAKWHDSSHMSLEHLEAHLSGDLYREPQKEFVPMADSICMETRVPIFANSLNKKTKKIEKGLFGVLVSRQLLGQSFAERMSKIGGMEVNLFLPDGKKATGTLAEYKQLVLSPGLRQSENKKGSVAFNEISQAGKSYFQAVIPLGAAGWISAATSKAKAQANTNQMMLMLAGVYLFCLVIVMPLAYWMARSFVRKVNLVVVGLKDIAEGEGDLTRRLEITSKDELGDLAHWFNVFIEKMHGIIKEVASNAGLLASSSNKLETFCLQMDARAKEVSDKSEAVTSISESVNQNIGAIASAMEQSHVNLSTVASAAEEMTATINEIANNTETANNITGQAVDKVQTASRRVDELGDAAQDIGNVVETITDISEQVNLLALNATIEAARAGEAGKGFAVVANEIKELANQTALATAEIKKRIAGIQQTADGTIDDIETITSIINEINEIVSTITAAIEEQSTTTKEIAGNVAQVSSGVKEVNEKVAESTAAVGEVAENLNQVNYASTEMSQQSADVREQTEDLSKLAAKLNQLVSRFKV